MNHALQVAHGPWTTVLRRNRLATLVVGVILALVAGTAVAAEVATGDTYVLPRGEVIDDDFYVSGGEVIVDGTVNGDLVAAGGYVEVNGVVTGDLIAAGGAVIVSGAVQDDVRVVGGGVVVSGSIGDDLFMAGGGGWPGAVSFPMSFGERTIPLGVQLMPSASVGGDAYITGGQGTAAGSVGGDLSLFMRDATFSGRVAGDATLAAQSLRIGEAAKVQGDLTVSTLGELSVPEGVAGTVETEPLPMADVQAPARNLLADALWWLVRTFLLFVGLAVSGWLVWTFGPRLIAEPAAVLEERPVTAGLYGLVAAATILPVSAALVFFGVLFWNWFPGGAVMLAFTYGVAALVWLLSPIVTGLWLGRKLAATTGWVRGDLASLLMGAALFVLVVRVIGLVPCIGQFALQSIYLVSFALTVGSWLLVRRRQAALIAQA